MALTAPILYSQVAFDSSQAQTFLFNVIGGTQVVSNTLTIKNNVTLATVYSQEQVTYKFEHIIPANTLVNGTYYQASLTTKDAQGNVSVASNIIQFYCYTTPSFTFSNLPTGNIIQNSAFNFEVTYNQLQGETLNAYVFNLFLPSGVLVATSNTLYNTSTTLPLIVSYLFTGFDNNSQYSIECTGVTSQGTRITTGKIQFEVRYIKPSVYAIVELVNNCQGGYVTVKSNIVLIEGESNPSPPIYIENKEVDLRIDDSWVRWSQGYNIQDNWRLGLWGRDFNANTQIFQYSALNGGTVSIFFNQESPNSNVWIEISVLSPDWEIGYYIESNKLPAPTETEQLFIYLKKINNVYEAIIENRGVIA